MFLSRYLPSYISFKYFLAIVIAIEADCDSNVQKNNNYKIKDKNEIFCLNENELTIFHFKKNIFCLVHNLG